MQAACVCAVALQLCLHLPDAPSSPQVLLGFQCSSAADIYSFGVLLWEIITGERPVRGHLRALLPEECPQEAAALFMECVQTEPSARPTAASLVQRLEALARSCARVPALQELGRVAGQSALAAAPPVKLPGTAQAAC